MFLFPDSKIFYVSHIFVTYLVTLPVTVAEFGSRDRGFESHTRHGCVVCVCVYSVFVLSCV
jgi:hypothetical protein